VSAANGQVQFWREGARWGQDLCPQCGWAGSTLAVDFQKFGRHAMRACLVCNVVWADGHRLFEIEKPKPADLPAGGPAPPPGEGFA